MGRGVGASSSSRIVVAPHLASDVGVEGRDAGLGVKVLEVEASAA
jgi:hypothetical protein